MIKRFFSNIFILSIVFCLAISIEAIATDTLIISKVERNYISQDENDYFLKDTYLEIYEDTSNEIQIEDIIENDKSINFRPNKYIDRFAFIENTSSSYWIKFYVVNNGSNKNYVFENLDQHIDHFELYVPDSIGKYHKMEAGFSERFDIREYPHKNFVFQFPIYNKAVPYYIRARSSNNNPFIFKIRTNEYFSFYSLNEYLLLGIFYGIMLIMALYNLLLFFSIKDKIYLYYVIYVICCTLISLQEDGIGFQYLWYTQPYFNRVFIFLSPILLIFSFWIYSKNFLHLKENTPHIDRLLKIVVALSVLYYILDKLYFHLEWKYPVYIFSFVIIYIGSVFSLMKGYRPARYYVVAYSFMMIGVLFLVLRLAFLVTSGNIFTVYSFNIGLVFEIVILSFALADRLKIIKKEKDQAQQATIEQLKENEKLKDAINRELEIKVEERTHELKEANEEMKVQNELLEEKNEQLEEVNLKLAETYDQLREQSEEILKINELLNEDKTKLEENVKELVHARVMLKDVDYKEFCRIYPDEESCLSYLASLKWDKGFICRKCGYTSYCMGKDQYSRRCNKCRYHESATAYTIFHKLKFPIIKAFYLVFYTYTNKGKVNSVEISTLLMLRQGTVWSFIKKVTEVMNTRIASNKISNDDDWTELFLE